MISLIDSLEKLKMPGGMFKQFFSRTKNTGLKNLDWFPVRSEDLSQKTSGLMKFWTTYRKDTTEETEAWDRQ